MVGRLKSAWWQILLGVAAVILVCLIAFGGVSSILQGYHALSALKVANANSISQRQATVRRIDLLNAQITALQKDATRNGGRIGQLLTEVEALQAQLRRLGVTPIVVETQTASPAAVPKASTQKPSPKVRPSSTPRTSRAPSPAPATSSRPPTAAPPPSPSCLLLKLGCGLF